jgi:hypothetical protein
MRHTVDMGSGVMILSRVKCVTIEGCGLANIFINHLHIPLGITSTYNATTNLHVKSSPACSVFTSRCLVTALNNGNSTASVLTSLLSGQCPTTEVSTELQHHLFSVSLAELSTQLTGSHFARTE